MSEQKSLGAIFSPPDVRDYRIACAAAPVEFPAEFELPMPEVKNQGQVCSCVAHALATTVEYFSRTQGDDDREMSVGYIYGNRRNTAHTGTGMVTRDAIAVTCDYGDVVKTLFPENEEVPAVIERFEKHVNEFFPKGYPNRFTSYYRCAGEAEMKTALTKGSPVIFAMQWHSGNYVDGDGILVEQGEESGGHCMVIYGWNARGWKFQNSWGTTWGKEGRAILPYTSTIREAWGVVDEISENQRKARIAELEASNAALAEKVEELTLEIEGLLAQLDILKEENANSEENQRLMEALSDSLMTAAKELSSAKETIERQKAEIERLTEALTTVKKPYDTKLGRFFAKLINAILGGLNWLLNRFRK